MPLSRIFGRTIIMALHAAFVPTVAHLLNGNWPSVAPERMTWTLGWAWQSVLAMLWRALPHACVEQPLSAEGINSVWRHMALMGWWTVGYFVLFVGFGQLIRQLPDYVRRMWSNLKASAAALAAREARN
jgi:hypothetical protein